MLRLALLLTLLAPLPAIANSDVVSERRINVFGGPPLPAVIMEVGRGEVRSPRFVLSVDGGAMSCFGKFNPGLQSFEQLETTCPGGTRFVTTRKGSKGRVVVDWLGSAPLNDVGPGDDLYWWHDSIFRYLRAQKRRE